MLKPKIALVHDWLVTYAGAERCLEQMLLCFPDADLFSVIDFIAEGKREWLLNKKSHTTYIQKLPFAKTKYRNYLPLMPLAIEQLDLSSYDIIISSSHAVAKGVITGPDQLHLSYVYSPMRYAWDLQHQYLRESNLQQGLKSWLVRRLLHRLRLWDLASASRVDHFMADSAFIARRIEKIYRRNATVIYPPVALVDFTLHEQKEDFYLTASRMVPYKKIDLIVEAFSKMPDKKLVVIGEGPDFKKIAKLGGKNVVLMGYQPFAVLRDHMQRAKAFVFAAEEDFGIVPVEAQSCGTPVIAYGKGGALETVLGLDHSMPTGVFFKEQSVAALIKAVAEFEQHTFLPQQCRQNAERFSTERFCHSFKEYVNLAWLAFKKTK
jgi:glycosyltransferase involved in cell wall biosynthesis